MGSRDFISPFDLYGSMMWGNAEIIEERPMNISLIVRRDTRQGRGRGDQTIAERVEGIHLEMGWSEPDLLPATNTCIYLQEMMETDIYDQPLKWSNLNSKEIDIVRKYLVEYGSSRAISLEGRREKRAESEEDVSQR